MGKAEDWQAKVSESLKELDIDILNPRRDNWDSSWVQTITNQKFKEQVDWELDNLDIADIILLNFIPNTLSPISLLELGLFAESRSVIVCCPEGYWRKGNIDIVCERYKIPLFSELDGCLEYIKYKLRG